MTAILFLRHIRTDLSALVRYAAIIVVWVLFADTTDSLFRVVNFYDTPIWWTAGMVAALLMLGVGASLLLFPRRRTDKRKAG
ncbi:MAG: hypothetical protein SF123_14070 [Chloroflexota bacterium]|nr:hypothetical protein [Chloroflexota bacterium]